MPRPWLNTQMSGKKEILRLGMEWGSDAMTPEERREHTFTIVRDHLTWEYNRGRAEALAAIREWANGEGYENHAGRQSVDLDRLNQRLLESR